MKQNSWLKTETFYHQKKNSQKMSSQLSQSFPQNIMELVQEKIEEIEKNLEKQNQLKEEKMKKNKLMKVTSNIKNEAKKENFKLKQFPNSCKKILFKPDQELKSFLSRCFGIGRYVYNRALNGFKNGKYELNMKHIKEIRNDCLGREIEKNIIIQNKLYNEEKKQKAANEKIQLKKNKMTKFDDQELKRREKYLLEKKLENLTKVFVPYDIKDNFITELINAKKNFDKLNEIRKFYNREEKPFQFKLKKKKFLKQETIKINHKNILFEKGIYFTLISKIISSCEEEIKREDIKYDFTVSRTGLGKYYICIPLRKEIYAENQGIQDFVSIDPGVRTPFVLFDSHKNFSIKFYEKQIEKIGKICDRIDDIKSYKQKIKNCKVKFNGTIDRERKKLNRKISSKLSKMRKLILRSQFKIRNLVKEAHYYVINFIVKNYRLVLLPKFQSQDMISNKSKRNIGKKTARMMCNWSHYLFRQRLIEKAKEKNCLVLLVDESYTSKTCGSCGELKNDLGKNEFFSCEHCSFFCDRDINGARNIMLKFLTKIST